MNFSERQIEDWLFQNPHALEGCKVYVIQWLARQMRLPSGQLDLLARVEASLEIVPEGTRLPFPPFYPMVIELKKGPITSASIVQACRYAEDIGRILEHVESQHGPLGDIEPLKMVIGTSIKDSMVYYEAVATNTYLALLSDSLQLSGPFWGPGRYEPALRTRYHQLSQDKAFWPFVELGRRRSSQLQATEGRQ